tara:strand:- start:5018 stop:5278 length:261 start_codon:yes stop_codon:yes gene_type:complete
MPSVECKNMSFEKALRIFKKKVERAGIKEEVRERQHYTKPNRKRYEQKKSAQRRREIDKLKEEQRILAKKRMLRAMPSFKDRRYET